ncbi:MAG TPA: 2-oxoacid:acceptor oxidoreductase subunit alpha [Methylomusa anaerophila]|uniref:2-oxoglutarate oxidoreductase subunit KorA n=1 Tax=Methylomusa anaerophila TaxID=1930071 RepID=A0A348AIU3_9FIRM|nr:2-oxoacid:acceptor oxidoreductase subunit alpha [Methylomusa anaerophila]BBB90991.1 2-oxoglutarate oxidoreductase subunit KorA [Methylomusa anaerophila]HML88863.1 2-oxoacid:acceptor oxidoreductase subunit alpha [Methylomusa anaerophila]
MEKVTFTVMFGGEAGYGVMSAGAIVAKAAARNGLWTFVVNEYPSLIKGGLNTCLVRIGSEYLQAYEEKLDFLGVLSQPGLDQNYGKLKPGAFVLHDADTVKVDVSRLPAGVRTAGVKLTRAVTGDAAKVMANSGMLGAFCALAGFDKEAIISVMRTEFTKEPVLSRNLEILESGYKAAAESLAGDTKPVFPLPFNPGGERKMLITGNDAISIGAIKAGVKFAAGYPMTPGSGILTYIADHAADYNIVFKQTEDEIAAINMLIGAGFAGVRAIGATSGGGFALMGEALGFAAQAEVPVVIVNAQRGAPSTGLPTRTAQGDLPFVTFAAQGEFPRIVVAPGDVEECYTETRRVFNLAEKYQVPAIILTDKYLADSAVAHPFFIQDDIAVDRGKLAGDDWLENNQPYLRYQFTDDGVSPRAIPGQKGGRHIATSYTHGEDGFYSSGNKEYAGSEPEITARGLDKQFAKVPFILRDIPGSKLYGPEDADLTVIGWGSTKGPVLEALAGANSRGMKVNFLQVLYMAPFPAEPVAAVLAKARQTLLVEGNKTAQLGMFIRANTGYHVSNRYLKYDSRPFVPSAILRKIEEVRG